MEEREGYHRRTEAERILAQGAVESARRAAGDPAAEAAAWFDRGRACATAQQFEMAMACYVNAEVLYRQEGRTRDVARVKLWVADALYNQGNYGGVISAGREARSLAREVGDTSQEASANRLVAHSYYALQNYSEAARFYERAQRKFRAAGDRKNSSAMYERRISAEQRSG